MTITNALAGIAVKNMDAAIRWYSALLEREPDQRPMEASAEWAFKAGGWIQVFQDGQRAGRSSVTLVEDDIEQCIADLKAKGLRVAATSESDFVKTAIIIDPDGNQIVFAEAQNAANRSA